MKKLRVLFAGNSHTYFNDMPQIFKQLAEAGQDVAVEATLQAQGGVTYAWHLKSAELRYGLLHGNYDYLFMQQAAHSPCPSPEETLRDGAKIIEYAKKLGVQPVVVVPWAEKRFPEHQATMYDTFTRLAKENGVKASPVGYVFERVLQERPDIDLYWYDGEHCSPYGSYVNAAMAYAMIFDASPVGLPCVSIKHSGGTAEDMQKVQALMDEVRVATNGFDTREMEKPENREKLDKVRALHAGSFPEFWNREEVVFPLDEEKCKTLQQMVWEAYQNQKV